MDCEIKRLKDLNDKVTMNSGVYLKPNPSGVYNYLNAKNFDSYGNIKEEYYNSTSKVELVGRNIDHSLKDGDLLLVAKGDRNKVCYYSTEKIGKAVASSTFIVLRCDQNIIKSKFLFWLMNTSLMQNNLSRLAKGTHVKSISIKVLSELEVSIPSLQMQEYFIKMHNLVMKENKMQKELIGLKERYYDNLLIKKLRGHEI